MDKIRGYIFRKIEQDYCFTIQHTDNKTQYTQFIAEKNGKKPPFFSPPHEIICSPNVERNDVVLMHDWTGYMK